MHWQQLHISFLIFKNGKRIAAINLICIHSFTFNWLLFDHYSLGLLCFELIIVTNRATYFT